MTDDELRAALRRLRDEVNNHTDSAVWELNAEILRTRIRARDTSTAEYDLTNDRINQLRPALTRLEELFVKLPRRVEKLEQKAIVPSPEPKQPDGKPEKPVGFT
jgi:predicted nuclease with TOPRIM domain